MDAVTKYFNAEKYESVVFILVGLTAIILAGYFLAIIKKPFHTGMAYPLMAIAFIQIVVGSTVYIRSPKDIERVNGMINGNKMEITLLEIPRMNNVMRNFEIYKYIEIALIITGIFLFTFIENDFIRGIGLGLIVQSVFMLILDFIAAARGEEYLQFLRMLK